MPTDILNSHHLELLRQHGHMREYPRKEYIVHEGEVGTSIYLMVRGSAAVLSEDSEGRALCVNILSPGTYFGEMGLYEPSWRRTASVQARSKCTILEISYSNFLQLSAKDNRLLIGIIDQLSKKLNEMTQRARQFAHMSAPERVLYVLRILSQQSDAIPHDGGALVSVTKHEIASIAGCTRETVSRALQELESDGLIANAGRKVLVKISDQQVV